MPGATDHGVDPLLSLDRYAFLHDRGLSSRAWRVLDARTTEIISGSRPRDTIVSLWIGALALNGLAAVIGAALIAVSPWFAVPIALVILACVGTAIVLTPMVLFRRRPPVVLRAHDDGRTLLEVRQRNRIRFARVRFEAFSSGGRPLGLIVHTPVRETLGSSWRIEPRLGRPLVVSEQSALRAIGRRMAEGSVAARFLRELVRTARVLRRREAPAKPVLFVHAEGTPGPLAQCEPDAEAPDWLWLSWRAAPDPESGALVLAAVLMAEGERF